MSDGGTRLNASKPGSLFGRRPSGFIKLNLFTKSTIRLHVHLDVAPAVLVSIEKAGGRFQPSASSAQAHSCLLYPSDRLVT